MTITTIPFSARMAGPYMATGGQTVFSYGFPIYAAGDLDVWREREGVVELLSLSTDYTVTDAGEPGGGDVVLTSGATEGDIIAIDGDLLKERATSFVGGMPFKTVFIDSDLNRLAIMVQELAREVSRSIRRVAVEENAGSLTLPIDVTENTLLALNAAGDVIGLIAGDFAGPEGDPGPAGTSIRSGTGAPDPELGNDGDFYIDTSASELYGPKTGGDWGSPTSLVGAPGAGTGDVVGPAGAVAGNAAVYSGTTGKIIADAGGAPALVNAANVFSAAQSVLRTSDADALIARNDDNTSAQRSALRIERGSGAGDDYLLTSEGDTSNGIAALRELIGATLLRRATPGHVRYARQVLACSGDTVPALTDAATVTWDWRTHQTATLTIADDRTLGTPGNARPGATAMIALTASGATRELALTDDYSLPEGVTSPLSIEAGDEWVLGVWYDGTRYKCVPTKFEAVP